MENTRLIEEQRRELARVAYRLADAEAKLGSVRYKLGALLVEALHHPGRKTLLLPFDLIKLWRARPSSTAEERQRASRSTPERLSLESASNPGLLEDLLSRNPKNTLLFVPINGTGLGHLARSLAIANQIRSIAPEKKILFFTTSVALPILFEQDYLAYHVPPRSQFEYMLSEEEWNEIFENTLEDILRIHNPGAVVFDGTYPYDGLKRTLQAHRSIKSVWVKRGLYRLDPFSGDTSEVSRLFDKVIVPGELDVGRVDTVKDNGLNVEPIVYLAPEGQMSKEDACRALRLEQGKPAAYVQLGAGNIDNIQELAQHLVSTLNARFPQLQIVIGESPIARSRFTPEGKYALLRTFPNSKYFNAFDIAILAAGYNSVYETIFFKLPTIFLPRKVGTDDQLARARLAEKLGMSRVMEEFEPELFCELVSELLQSEKPAASQLSFRNGAERAARFIVDAIDATASG